MEPYQMRRLIFSFPDQTTGERIFSDRFWNGSFNTEESMETCEDIRLYDTAEQNRSAKQLILKTEKCEDEVFASICAITVQADELHLQEEWHQQIDHDSEFPLDIKNYLQDSPFGALTGERLPQEFLHIKFKSTSVILSDDQENRIKLTVNDGSLIAGERTEPFYELILKLFSGDTRSLILLSAELADHYRLLIEKSSAFEKGLQLAHISIPNEVNGQQSFNPMEKTVREAAEILCVEKLIQMIGAQHVFLENAKDPESAHQFRVKIRQLRALLSFFKPLASDLQYSEINNSMRTLANRFSSLRELDVMIEQWRDFCFKHPELPIKKSKLNEVLRRKRHSELSKALRYVANGETTSVLLNTWAFLYHINWINHAEVLMQDFAKPRIKKWMHRFASGLSDLNYRDSEATHALRILGKKIRYAQAELYQTENKSKQKNESQMKEMQNKLGAVCDADRNREILLEIYTRSDDSALKYEIGLLLGYQASRSEQLISELKK